MNFMLRSKNWRYPMPVYCDTQEEEFTAEDLATTNATYVVYCQLCKKEGRAMAYVGSVGMDREKITKLSSVGSRFAKHTALEEKAFEAHFEHYHSGIRPNKEDPRNELRFEIVDKFSENYCNDDICKKEKQLHDQLKTEGYEMFNQREV